LNTDSKVISMLLAAALIACSTILVGENWTQGAEPLQASRVIFWYSRVSPMRLAEASPELVFVDLEELSPLWVRRLRAAGSTIIAYVNFGMAEKWRDYWRDEWLVKPPEWLGPESAEWRGEYLVRFWHPRWLQIIRGLMEEALRLGFDGVLLDNLDVCEYWGTCGLLPEALRSLIKGVELKLYVNVGEAWRMLYDEELLRLLNGVVLEDALTSHNTDAIGALRYAEEHGKTVVLLEYASSREKIEELLNEGREMGFMIFVGQRELDGLPRYVPLYHGVQLLEGKVLYSYRAPWDRFRVFLDGVEVGVGKRASGAVRGNVTAIAYETLRDGERVVRVFLGGEVVYESEPECASPKITAHGEGFAAVYICDRGGRRDVFLLRIDESGRVVSEERITGDEWFEEYPLIASNGDMVAVVFERNGSLIFTDLKEFKVLGEVEPYSYALTPFDDGFAVVYSGPSGSAVVFPNSTVKGILEILWESNAVAYRGMLYYVSRSGRVIMVCPNGFWWNVRNLERIYPAGMWLAIINRRFTVLGPDSIPGWSGNSHNGLG